MSDTCFQFNARDPFHFAVNLTLPPDANAEGTTYFAYTDYPNDSDFDGLPIPDWLHFDPRDLEL